MNEERTHPLQFSLREILGLTAVLAVWLWFLLQHAPVRGAGVLIVTVVALVAGLIGHVVYIYVLRWRGIVVITSLVAYSAPAFLLFVLASQFDVIGAVFMLVETLIAPARELVSADRMLEWETLALGCTMTLLFVPAHFIRPTFPTAIVTAFGVAAWYLLGLFVTIGRNFGA
jgi:hypothetical protein